LRVLSGRALLDVIALIIMIPRNAPFRHCAAILMPLAALMSAAAATDTEAWPGWRGPARDARVADFIPPEVWPEKLEQVWRVEVGEGYPTALVAGDRIFQHARQAGEEVLWCLDLKSGKPLWRQATAVGFEPAGGGERHGAGPKSTPTFADGRVFTLSITGLLSAWAAEDGKLLWRRDFKERFDVAHPHWGTSTSPLVENGRLYVHTGTCEEGALFCIDPATGKDLWVRDEDAHCYSSPIVETFHGVRQFVEFNHAGLCGIDLESGRLLWKHPFPHRGNNQNTPTPARHGDLLVLGGENRGVFGVRPRLENGKWSVEAVWQHRQVSLDMSSLVVSEGLAYGFSHLKMGRIFCLDPATGTVLWEGEPRAGDNGQFLALPGHVLSLTDGGMLQVLRHNREACEIVRSYRVADDGTWTAPALVGDALLIKDRTHLTHWRLPGKKDGAPAQGSR
jgi:outer membrane protein assembly factor BamB